MLNADFDHLREELPADIWVTLRQYETAGTTDDPAYKQAERVFDLRHVCRIDPWPEYLERALKRMPVGKVNLEDWNIRGYLDEIGVPTLITCGRFDFCTPTQAELIHNGIPNSELVIFEESSHYAHVEETERSLAVLNEFQTRIEQQAVTKV